MFNIILKLFFLIGLIAGSTIRLIYGRKYKTSKIVNAHKESIVILILMILWGVSQILPLFSIFTSWLDFADYSLLVWASIAGAAIYSGSIFLLWKSHADLGRNWSPALEIREEQTIIKTGIYRKIRHPMYAAHFLWGIGQLLLIHNWIAGMGALIVFIPFYLIRIPIEEQLLIDQFGDQYRKYMNETGGIFPKL